ncbi:GNAT family N-acetyltransferase [Yoonia litorea]|uniref:Protein N-acetyltransferase, RimJ/RimL family n=1 Tax=Yoonia litorea TaxID=1123755 RepID=A0A1I6LCI4_9RHOB|nr:GNAT family N-acetyltransferase [Yoonia litorea]SFS01186.1 Protein N-acetyltransferase, RimJ/RimL family [Yoonia litorea]
MSELSPNTTITTKRLRLEPFAPDHATALNAINNEPEVMEFLSSGDPQSLDETRAGIARVQERWARLGYGWWSIFLRKTDTIIGAACVQNVSLIEGAELEIGWRLATAATGKGYATEAGLAAARYAFDVVGVDHVIAVADQRNINSHRVMKRIGMQFRSIERHYDEDCTTYVLHKADLTRS